MRQIQFTRLTINVRFPLKEENISIELNLSKVCLVIKKVIILKKKEILL